MAADTHKYCDLVMKGGITSGIVYPNAVLELAKQYRFKNIGGTSAGAIAAAITAAAAVGDRKQQVSDEHGNAGFEGMQAVAKALSTKGFIYSLFQPAGGARNAFRLVVLLTSPAPVWRKAMGSVIAVLAIAPVEFVLLLALLGGWGAWVSGWDGLRALLLPALLLAYAAAAVCALLRTARAIRGNLLGLCSGMSGGRAWPWWRKPPLALTQWLHQQLQQLSRKTEAEPLTFADLRGAPRYADEPTSDFAVHLQMITTSISHREPRSLPFSNKTFWFLECDFARLFPQSVVQWMILHGGGAPLTVDGVIYHRLPEGEQLPVLVATRMSLSFPLLVSAVPLYEPARYTRTVPAEEAAQSVEDEPAEDAPAEDAPGATPSLAQTTEGLTSGGERAVSQPAAMRICWFSDGGIGSNFPVHLFDSPLPLWPTFAINLLYPGPQTAEADQPEASEAEKLDRCVFLPRSNNQGWRYTYQPIAANSAIRELGGLVFGIVGTMQNWRDLLQMRAPGYRDRIVHVSLEGIEGGMNLNMPQPVLARISAKGALAGKRFGAFSFANHYWIRWRNLSAAWQRYTGDVLAHSKSVSSVPADAAVFALPTECALAPSYRLRTPADCDRSRDIYKEMVAQGDRWRGEPDLSNGAPKPLPQLRIAQTY